MDDETNEIGIDFDKRGIDFERGGIDFDGRDNPDETPEP